ncbi:MAG: hypothetical protein ACEQSF_00040 [Solirubrobacteraceae bacterium]
MILLEIWLEAQLAIQNVLTKNLNNIELGGAINKPTIISGITNTNKLSFTATGVDAININSTTLSLDAQNNRVGFGTASPGNTVEIVGTATNSGLRLSSIPTKGLLGTNATGDIISKPAISNELFFDDTNFYYVSMKIEATNYKVVRYNKNDVNDEKNASASGTQTTTLSTVQSLTYS